MTESSQAPAARMDEHKFVIVLGVDTPIGLAILRDLGRHGFTTIGIGRSEQSIGFASRHCHHQIIRASSEQALIEQISGLAQRFAQASLIAISEHDHLLINRHRETLESALTVLGAKQTVLDLVLDKEQCNLMAANVGIRTPDTYHPASMAEAEQRATSLSYPRVIKWSDPNKVGRALEAQGLPIIKYQYAQSAPQLLEILRPYEAIDEFPLVQEYCPGGGFGQMFLVHQGEIILQFQHERIHEWPPEGGVSSLCKGVPLSEHQACREKSIALLRALGWEGVAMVEYRYDRDSGEYYFMEINGRFWGSLPLAINSGVPFASALVQSGNSQNMPQQGDYRVRACRFMIPETRRIVRLLFQPGQIQDPYFRFNRVKELFNYLAAFFKPGMTYYIFEANDAGPFYTDVANVLKKAAFWRR